MIYLTSPEIMSLDINVLFSPFNFYYSKIVLLHMVETNIWGL
jgi:hypothetical protein